MSISIRVNKTENDLIKNYAKLHGTSVSEVVRQAILEKIEDEFDLVLFNEAINSYKEDSKTYSLKEVKEMLNID